MKYVAYYRVSTPHQGQSGLGLEAQRADVEQYVNGANGDIVAEFTDVESGKKANRAELLKAIALCKATGATWTAIANELNDKGFKTSQGKAFQAIQVQRLFERTTQ